VILAIALMSVSEPSKTNVIVALTVVYIPRMARLVRGKALLIKEMPYVEAAHALGVRVWRVIATHVLPNALPEIIVMGSFIFGYAILDEATLSFLGVGPPPPAPSWGNMLSESRVPGARRILDQLLPRLIHRHRRAGNEHPRRWHQRSL